jgi:hypothetical protein
VRRILMVTVLVLAVLTVGGVTATGAVAADAPTPKVAKVRSLILAYAKSRALEPDEEHGTASNWGVVPGADCVKKSIKVNGGTFPSVACAYGIFWADGHECFNLRRVYATTGQNGAIKYVQKNLHTTSCDDDGTTNGGTSTAGTANDIDPDGTQSQTASNGDAGDENP